MISGHRTGLAHAEDGMGDVRVFWLAAAIAVLAVVAVVAVKLNGRDVRSALFGNVWTWSQPVRSAPAVAVVTSGRDAAFKLEPNSAQLAR